MSEFYEDEDWSFETPDFGITSLKLVNEVGINDSDSESGSEVDSDVETATATTPATSVPPDSGVVARPPTADQEFGPGFEGDDHEGHHLHFQYSQCTGKRRGLFVGINYIGQFGQLAGCINDVKNITQWLIDQYGWKREEMRILTDDTEDPEKMPTTKNILEGMLWLVSDAKADDSLFFHYAGHGAPVADHDGDEDDGFDEAIIPCDCDSFFGFPIIDDMMHSIMVEPLPAGCRLTALMDCCHSGSALDLPYMYTVDGQIMEPNLSEEAQMGLLAAQIHGDQAAMLEHAKQMVKQLEAKKAHEISRKTKTSAADVIAWSGCKDSQTSADTSVDGEATGAMSWAFRTALTKNPKQSYKQLLNTVHEMLEDKYEQKPQLTSSHPIDTDIMFII
ncbi:caspase domain-containing protein [Flagelloscypha sp. PMI_526]|nr:caspase domain-containing protein [Flagelloscypha sp. PMI_526]